MYHSVIIVNNTLTNEYTSPMESQLFTSISTSEMETAKASEIIKYLEFIAIENDLKLNLLSHFKKAKQIFINSIKYN